LKKNRKLSWIGGGGGGCWADEPNGTDYLTRRKNGNACKQKPTNATKVTLLGSTPPGVKIVKVKSVLIGDTKTTG